MNGIPSEKSAVYDLIESLFLGQVINHDQPTDSVSGFDAAVDLLKEQIQKSSR